MDNKKSRFITFEGGEGSGKTTQIAILHRTLVQLGIDVVLYREPGGTQGAEEIRHLILKGDGNRWTAKAEALLMSASRAELVEKCILPHLEKGTWVLCDRFTDSTLAYQGYGHGLCFETMEWLNNFTVGNLEPDLTFIFQLPPELGLGRTIQRKEGEDRYERFDLKFHFKVAEGYKEILKRKPERCVAIDALLEIDEISQLIFNEIKNRFGKEESRKDAVKPPPSQLSY
jgi:dTMP kinase